MRNKLKTFPIGGVHPPDTKLSANKPIEKLNIPKEVRLILSQHLGVPATPVVNPNDQVKVGQLIAKAEGFISANIHSSVSGKVTKIDNVIDASGYKKKAVFISVEGDEWTEGIDLSEGLKKDISIGAKDIVKKVQENGIVGMGGATFPTHVKLSVPDGKKADYLLINGVECEPYLTSDHRLMLEKGEEILVGVQLMMKALNVNKAIIGIEKNKPDAIEHLSKLVKKYNDIEVQGLKVQYPQGAEKQLVEALTKRQIPAKGLPIDCGCVVQNVGTAFAVYEAVQKNKPLIERVVTITGKSLKNPSNFMVRIGTSINELVAAAGGFPEDTGKIISGGPMMGKALNELDSPVTKGTSGVVLMTIKETNRAPVLNCIRCGRCVSGCPLGLEPYLLMSLIEKNGYERAEDESIMNCCECGTCSYVCPAKRPLLDYMRLGKSTVGKIIKDRKK